MLRIWLAGSKTTCWKKCVGNSLGVALSSITQKDPLSYNPETSVSALYIKPWMLRSETENPNGVLETFLTMLDPHGPGNPSRMVVHVCCQKTRHGWILIWKQTSFGLAVFLEHSLVEKGPKTKCCRFCNLHWGCSHQRPYFDPTIHFILVASCSTHKGHNFLVWCDAEKLKWFKGL